MNVKCYDSLDELRDLHKNTPFYYATTKAAKCYTDVAYPDECFVVFGKETAGLPEDLLNRNAEWCVRIPMRPGIRSLNLSNSAAIIAYEALRQNGFTGLKSQGKMGME